MNKFTIDLKKGISYSRPYINKFSSNFDTVEFITDADDSLSECSFAVIYSIDGNTGMSVAGGGNVTKEYDTNNKTIRLTWLLGRDVSCDDGVVLYQVVAYKTENEKTSAVWYSPQGRIIVGNSIDTTEYETLQIGSQPSLVSQFLIMANTNKNDIQSLNSKSNILQSDISDIRENILSIESDICDIDADTKQLFQNTDTNAQSILLHGEQISQLDNKINSVDNNLKNVELTVYANNDDLLRQEKQLEDIETDIDNIKINASNISKRVENNKTNIDHNKSKINTMQNSINYNYSVTANNSERITNAVNNINQNKQDINLNSQKIKSVESSLENAVADIERKVDKVEGMGLSEQNFTQDDKQLLQSIETKPGMITDDGGEIFNDYEHNQSKSKYATANGAGTIADGDYIYLIQKIAFNGYDPKRMIVNDEESLSKIKIGDYISGEFTYDKDLGGFVEPGGTKTFFAQVMDIDSNEIILDSAIASDNLNAWIVTSSYITGTRYNTQSVSGQYNIADSETKYLNIIGNGINDTYRSNAYTLDRNGIGWFKGGVKVGGISQNNGKFLDIDTRFTQNAQINFTTEEVVNNIIITRIGNTNISDKNYTVMKILIENACLEQEGSYSETIVKVNNTSAYISAASTFINNDEKLFWGGYINLKEGLLFEAGAPMGQNIWRNNAKIPMDSSSLHEHEKINEISIKSVLTDIPVGTKIKIWLK